MSRPCPVCRTTATTPVTGEFEGYVEGWTTCLCVCPDCDLTFSARRDVPEDLYDAIYRQPDQIFGYDRYVGYAEGIRQAADPATWLAEREAPYRVALEWLETRPEVGTVLEIGSGLGYLTHALRRRGVDAVGVDLSEDAVLAARRRFDEPEGYFLPEGIAERHPDGVDVVVGLEIVEHVPDPVAFVREAIGYLRPGGSLVLSTPNRDAFTAETLWDSDTPPVHLTWFGSRSMKALADAVDAEVSFLDAPDGTALPESGPNEVFAPFLTADGRATRAARAWTTKRRRVADTVLTRAARPFRQGRQRLPGVPRPWLVPPTSKTLGVVLTPR
jgi:2-polyprenyl-3-methyl-5-hydroxy-6-metoxy-1,4-benzoquinol methylase